MDARAAEVAGFDLGSAGEPVGEDRGIRFGIPGRRP